MQQSEAVSTAPGYDLLSPGASPEGDELAASKYEILRVVNRGGMGEIALARARGSRGFEKLLVLKRLRADAEREDHIEMFDVEQELMSRIEHPNIVKVFDQPILSGIHYLAMEYVRGRNLDQVIRSAAKRHQPITLRFSLSVIAEVLRGLAFVHRMKDHDGKALGIVHQDMTPSNVMISFFGEVKITDFGISYVTSRDGGLRRGVLKGKPRYVAPEVLAGKRVNNRADLYGTAVVLFELLKGEALFARQSVKETLAAVARNELPDFEEALPEIPAGVVGILKRALMRDPQERYRSAEEMAADVLVELNRVGGPLPPATMGAGLRRLFEDDPDVPDVDPELDAIVSQNSAPGSTEALGLAETLEELDRLMGDGGQIDVFSLPDELAPELSSLEDMAPFEALTPMPEILWDATSDDERLKRVGGPVENALVSPYAEPDVPPLLSPSQAPIPTPDLSSVGRIRPTPSPATGYAQIRATAEDAETLPSDGAPDRRFVTGLATGFALGALCCAAALLGWIV